MRGSRGSVFFVLDALIASAILIAAVVIVYSFFAARPEGVQTRSYGADYLSFLATTQVRDFENPSVAALIANGDISNTRLTLGKQILLFHGAARDDLAWILINETSRLVPGHLPLNVSYDDGTSVGLYDRNMALVAGTRSRIVSRRVEFVMDDAFALVGPGVLQVEVYS